MPHASLPRTRATGPVRSTSSTAVPAPADAPITVRPVLLQGLDARRERRLHDHGQQEHSPGARPNRLRPVGVDAVVHEQHRAGPRCHRRAHQRPGVARDPSRPTARARDRPTAGRSRRPVAGMPATATTPCGVTESDIALSTASATSTTLAPFERASSINSSRRGASSVTNSSLTSAPDRRASPIANGPSTRKVPVRSRYRTT